MNRIYLDNNATTHAAPEVIEVMREHLAARYGNPASQHSTGRTGRRIIEHAREQIAELLGARTSGLTADRLIFTSGGTEANNLAILGQAMEGQNTNPGTLICSPIEHPSIRGPVDFLINRGWKSRELSVAMDGAATLESVQSLDLTDVVFATLMLANNETGVVQPVQQLAARCVPKNIPLHCDAVQAIGKIRVSFDGLGVTSMTIAPHKFHGPTGIGALLIRADAVLQPQLLGGFQQSQLRPGTESVALVAGFAKALQLAFRDLDRQIATMTRLRDDFERQLMTLSTPVVINGQSAHRLPHTSNVSFLGIDRQALLLALDQAGVDCSTGSACASGSSEPSPVLVAMGLKTTLVDSAIRFSFSRFSSTQEIDEALLRISRCVNSLRPR